MTPEEFQEFLTLIFYPAEMVERLEQTLRDPEQLRSFCTRTLRHEFELVRVLAARYSLKRAMEVFPPEYRELHGRDAPRADDRARQGVRRGDRRRAAPARPGARTWSTSPRGSCGTWRSTS